MNYILDNITKKSDITNFNLMTKVYIYFYDFAKAKMIIAIVTLFFEAFSFFKF